MELLAGLNMPLADSPLHGHCHGEGSSRKIANGVLQVTSGHGIGLQRKYLLAYYGAMKASAVLCGPNRALINASVVMGSMDLPRGMAKKFQLLANKNPMPILLMPSGTACCGCGHWV